MHLPLLLALLLSYCTTFVFCQANETYVNGLANVLREHNLSIAAALVSSNAFDITPLLLSGNSSSKTLLVPSDSVRLLLSLTPTLSQHDCALLARQLADQTFLPKLVEFNYTIGVDDSYSNPGWEEVNEELEVQLRARGIDMELLAWEFPTM